MTRTSECFNQQRIGRKIPQAAGFSEGEDSLNPAVPFFVEASLHHAAPQHCETKHSLRAIVRGVDTFFQQKDPKTTHLGIQQPHVPPAPAERAQWSPWAALPRVLDLAKRKNVVIKVSGACTLSKEPYPFPDIWEPLARVFDAWGIDRCLWGTDWTRAAAVVDYAQAVEPFRTTTRLSDAERAMLMGGACAKAYRWQPKR